MVISGLEDVRSLRRMREPVTVTSSSCVVSAAVAGLLTEVSASTA